MVAEDEDEDEDKDEDEGEDDVWRMLSSFSVVMVMMVVGGVVYTGVIRGNIATIIVG